MLTGRIWYGCEQDKEVFEAGYTRAVLHTQDYLEPGNINLKLNIII